MTQALHVDFEGGRLTPKVQIITDNPANAADEMQQFLDLETEDGKKLSELIEVLEPVTINNENSYFEINAGLTALIDGAPLTVSEYSATLEFEIYNDEDPRYKEKIKSVSLKDPSGIYANAPALTCEDCEHFSLLQFMNEQQRREITPSLRAAIDAMNILTPVLADRITESKLPYEEKKKFFASVAERTFAGLTRQDHARRERVVLRGQKGSEGSESFKKAVKTFAERQITRLIRLEHEVALIQRDEAHNISDDIILAHAAPRTLAGELKAQLKKKSRDERTLFIAQIQEAAKAAAFDNDSGNGFAALATMLSIQRGLRYSLAHRKRAATEKEDRENTAEHVQWKKQNVDTKDIAIPANANLDEGYFPCGLENDCFAIYADAVLKRINMPASYENIVETENELHKMAGVKLTSKSKETQASVANYNFLSSRQQREKTPGKRERTIWMIWNLSSAFSFPEPVPRNQKFSFQQIDPNMYSEINRLANIAGLHRPTIGLLNKTAFLINSQIQKRADGNAALAKQAQKKGQANAEANAEQTPAVQKITRIEIKRSKLPLPEDRRARKQFLEILTAALKVVGIDFTTEGKDFAAVKTDEKARESSNDKG